MEGYLVAVYCMINPEPGEFIETEPICDIIDDDGNILTSGGMVYLGNVDGNDYWWTILDVAPVSCRAKISVEVVKRATQRSIDVDVVFP